MRETDRVHRAALLLAALLGSCTTAQPGARTEAPSSGAAPGAPAVCRVGPDGGPPIADRGIGGAGVPSGVRPAAVRQADRGIGGTGAPPAAVREADRGIGGTGIVGVVTGFASVCLAGREVALDDATAVRVDGEPATPAALRAGQVAAVEAAGAPGALRARAVAVRHEVVGPVEAVEAGGVLRVAGQRVAVSAQTWKQAPPRPGEWLAVGGLRGPDGTVQATRLDRRAPGAALVRATLARDGGTLRIGALEVRPAPGLRVSPGRDVTASGRYEGGVLHADALAPDLLAEDPAAYFGPGVAALALEGYVAGGRVRFGRGLDAPAPAGFGAAAPRRAIVEFERRPDGSLRATGLREPGLPPHGPAGGPGAAPAAGPAPGGGGPPAAGRPGGPGAPGPTPPRTFEPAPVPDRASDGGPGGARSGGDGPGRGRGGGTTRPDPGRPGFGPGPGGFGGGPGGPGPGGGRGR